MARALRRSWRDVRWLDADRRAQGDQDPRIPGRPDAGLGARAGRARPRGRRRDTTPATRSAWTTRMYEGAGARIAADAAEVFAGAELIVKVKEPQAEERALLREGQVLFTYLHLAPDPEQTSDLMASGCIAIAYETVTDERGGLPLLAPMSAVAGRMSIQAGAHSLELAQGGSGVLLPGVPGRRARQGADHRRRRGRHQRRDGGARHGRPRRAAGTLGAPHLRARPRVRPAPADPLLDARHPRGGAAPGRPGDRRDADPGRRRAQADQARAPRR